MDRSELTERDLLWLHVRELPYFRSLLRSVEARILREVPLPRPALDLGCGDGHFAWVTFPAGVDVGIDTHAPSLREARRRGCFRMLSRADGSRLPLASGSMASAFSNSVLEHIPPIDAVLREIGRVLAKGAPLAFTVPNPAFLSGLSVRGALRKIGAEALADSYAAWFRWITRVKHLDDEGAWAARLSQAGFHLERTFRYFSPEALRVMEWGHYFGAPSLLARWITGRWIVWPAPLNLRLTLSLIRRYDESSARPDGTFTFYLARRK